MRYIDSQRQFLKNIRVALDILINDIGMSKSDPDVNRLINLYNSRTGWIMLPKPPKESIKFLFEAIRGLRRYEQDSRVKKVIYYLKQALFSSGYNDSLPLSLHKRHRKYSDIGFNVSSGMSAVLDRIIQARRELSQCKIINVKTELSNLNAAIRLFDNGLLEKLTPLLNVTAKVLNNSYNKATDTVNSHTKTSMSMSIAYNNDATHIYNAYKLIETAADRSRYIIDPQKNLLPDIKEENKYSPVRIRRKANSKDSIPYGCRYNLFLSDAGVKGMKKGEHRMARDPEYVEALRSGGGGRSVQQSTPPRMSFLRNII